MSAADALGQEAVQSRAKSWQSSLLGKFIVACLAGVVVAYSVGFLVGWIMITSVARDQWRDQALTNMQVATATLRNIYTYASIETDSIGRVTKIVTDRPIGDDESVLFTGFSPVDVLALISNQTKTEAWIFRYDASRSEYDIVARTNSSGEDSPAIEAGAQPLFDVVSQGKQGQTGFATIDGVSHFVGLLPLMTPHGEILGAVASSIGRQADLIRTQDQLIQNALIAAASVLIVIGTAVLILARGMFSPVPALIEAVLRIAGGQTETETPFQRRSDEIGDLAVAIETLREVVVERGRLREIRDWAVELEYLAHHDPLTGLANRALLMRTLETDVRAIDGSIKPFNILLLDLDRFKAINDTLGHGVGDDVLVAIAGRISAVLGPDDMAARLGGDEFAIIQAVKDDAELEGSVLATRIIETISSGLILGGQDLLLGVSIGIACAPNHGQEASFLLRNADLALYRAKGGGRGTYRIFEVGMDAIAHDQHALHLDLPSALLRDEFVLHYQPIVALGTKKIRGYEALIRWNHPHLGLVSPARFIPLAEETGMIIPIGEWVLRRACKDAMTWPDDMTVAVNMSPVQIRHDGTVRAVVEALEFSGLTPNRLELEITETALLSGDASTDALGALRDMGIRIALDDFGTGYASLSYLTRFPYHKIKVDRSFVANLSVRNDCRVIVAAIVNLAHGLGMETTAEGVETDDQMVILRAIGCTNVQGYYLGRPMPASDVTFDIAASEIRNSA